MLAQLENVSDRDQAAALVGADIAADARRAAGDRGR